MRPRVAVITGAGGGIGRSITQSLAADGLYVIAVDLDLQAAEDTIHVAGQAGAPGGRALQADVRDYKLTKRLVSSIMDELHGIDVLVNCAGTAQPKAFLELNEEDWDTTIAVHLKGAFNWSQAVATPMVEQQWGRIICISSNNAKTGGGFPGLSKTAYAAAKAGILGLVRGLARELAPHVTVNAICPGLIATPMVAAHLAGLNDAEVLSRIPARRLGVPEDVAHAVSFLASERASYITGEVMDVNGGSYID